MLLKRECADGLSQLRTVTGLSSKLRVFVRVQGVRVVRGRVHSGKRWMQIAVTTDDFFSVTQN